jgi:hypothetical protein
MSATMNAPTAQQQFPGAAKLLASITIPPNPRMPVEIEAKLQMADLFLKSGLAPQAFRSREAVFVALQYGDELGLSPWASMRSVYLVNGKPSCDTNILLGVADSNGLIAGFRVVERSDSRVVVAGRRPGDATEHTSAFTIEEAKRAGLTSKENWQKYPADMLFARATGRLLKIVCPSVFAGLVTREEAEDEDKAPAPAWRMTAKFLGEMRAVVKARDVTPDALKAIERQATGGRKVEKVESIPQYTEGEATMILSALKSWRATPAPAQAEAPAPSADPSPEDVAAIRAELEAEEAAART